MVCGVWHIGHLSSSSGCHFRDLRALQRLLTTMSSFCMQVEEIMLLNTKVKRWDGACIYVRFRRPF